jgi:DNA polymerase III subunit epsilon
MAWYKKHPTECPLVWIDTETGGLDTARAALLEVAVIVTDITGCHVRDRFEARIRPFPDDVIEQGAVAVNGYDEHLWTSTAKARVEVVGQLSTMCYGGIFAGHNVPFDYAMVMRFLGRYGVREWPGPHWKVDTIGLAWPLLLDREVPDLKLTTLTAHLGIEHEKAHTAMADCEAARQVYCALMERWANGRAA